MPKKKSKAASTKAQKFTDHQVKPRHGVRLNEDGSKSSHLMRREYVKDRGWVAFPTLYQDQNGEWLDLGNQYGDDWEPILDYATNTGEVYDFGEDIDAAINFADKGSWKQQFAGGGKLFGSGKIGDAFKLYGDYALSTVGLTDVIGDDAYRNQGMADASRVAENFGKGAGKVAANLLLPGVGGALMNTAQNTLGNIDGEDSERARVEQMRANPEAWGKYAGTIDQMSGAIDPLAQGASLAGEVGSVAAGNFMQHGNVLGDLSGMKNSFGQGLFGKSMSTTVPSGITGNIPMGNIMTKSPVNLINTGQSVLDANQGQSLLGPDPFANEIAVPGLAYGGTMKNKKYANGGPIKMGEQVTPGSARHKEILELEKQNQAYQDRMAQLAPMIEKYGDPQTYTSEQISAMSPAFDPSTVPSGSSILGFNVNPNEETMGESPFFAFAPESGKAEQAYNFFTAPTQPDAVPEYDLIEDDIDMSISPEKVFSPIQGEVFSHASGNPVTRDIGYTYGYEGQKPESITTVNPYTREQMFGANDSFTSGFMNQDFGSLPGMQGVPMDNVMTNDQLREQAIQNEIARRGGRTALAYGGSLDQLPDGGKFIEYQGPSHDGGGIDVDASGVPTAASGVAEVEGGETLHDNGIENYIFSDRLVVNPGDKKKKTFADLSKKINNKYKNTDEDPIAQNTRKLELENLKVQQENLKQMMSGGTEDDFACGGKMKHAVGGGLGIDPMSEKVYGNLNTALAGYNPLLPPSGIDNALSMLSASPMDRLQATTNQFDVDSSLAANLADKGEYFDKRQRSGKLESGDVMPQNQANGLPQDTINPLGYLASNVGNIYDLAQASKETPKNQFGRMTPETIDLEAQRTELKNQAATSRAIARENARNAPSAGGAMTNRVIANALINSGLGSQLSQSYMTEANQNAAIKNQAKQINLQTQIQEKLADQQDLAMRKSTISQAMHNIGMNTQGYARDLKSAKVGNINNKMWFDMVKEGKYVDYAFDNTTGTFIMKLKDGRVITKKGDEITEIKPDSKG